MGLVITVAGASVGAICTILAVVAATRLPATRRSDVPTNR